MLCSHGFLLLLECMNGLYECFDSALVLEVIIAVDACGSTLQILLLRAYDGFIL